MIEQVRVQGQVRRVRNSRREILREVEEREGHDIAGKHSLAIDVQDNFHRSCEEYASQNEATQAYLKHEEVRFLFAFIQHYT